MGKKLISKVKLATRAAPKRSHPLLKIQNVVICNISLCEKQYIWRKAGQLDLTYKPS